VSTLDGILRMWLEADEAKKDHAEAEGREGHLHIGQGGGVTTGKRSVHHSF